MEHKKKSLTRAGAIGAAALPLWINFYCQGYSPDLDCEENERKKLVCINNVDESPRPTQTNSETASNWGTIDYSKTTASGSASVSPSPSPPPPPPPIS